MSINRYWRLVVYALAILLVAGLALNWRGWAAQAQVGAGYGARMSCSCRYVEGRDIQSCKGDTEPGMWIVSISDSPESKSVTARVPLMANRTARYQAGWGCLLDPMK